MWDDIGGKIKGLAKIIALLGIISSIIGGFVFFNIARKMSYSGIYFGIGLATMFIGSLLSWIASWFMYGFGELIEKTSEIEILKNYIINNRENINENISGIIFANISKDINLDEFDAFIQLNESESKNIYKILEKYGRNKMNQYIKNLLKKYKEVI